MEGNVCPFTLIISCMFLTLICDFFFNLMTEKFDFTLLSCIFFQFVDCVKLIAYNYYFLLPISRESIAFGSNFRNGDFDGFTRFEVS